MKNLIKAIAAVILAGSYVIGSSVTFHILFDTAATDGFMAFLGILFAIATVVGTTLLKHYFDAKEIERKTQDARRKRELERGW